MVHPVHERKTVRVRALKMNMKKKAEREIGGQEKNGKMEEAEDYKIMKHNFNVTSIPVLFTKPSL